MLVEANPFPSCSCFELFTSASFIQPNMYRGKKNKLDRNTRLCYEVTVLKTMLPDELVEVAMKNVQKHLTVVCVCGWGGLSWFLKYLSYSCWCVELLGLLDIPFIY